MKMLFRGVLFAAISFSALGQLSADRSEALKQVLGLSGSQMWQLQQRRPKMLAMNQTVPLDARRAIYRGSLQKQTADSLRDQVLNDSQRAKLAVIQKVLQNWHLASAAIVLGLISPQQWPGGTLCYYPIPTYSSELGLSGSQVRQFEQLQQAAREPLYAQIKEKENNRLELLNSGVSADSPIVVQLVSEIARLRNQVALASPRRDRALAILDDAQKAKLAAFETDLELASQAIELGLIPIPLKGEVLCH
jgi:hypothetical protein